MNKQITIVDINVPQPYGKNPRKNDAAVEAVANSIKEFGFKNPIIVDKNYVIIAGHTRLRAAKKLGLKEVPVIIADDLTEEQVKAFRLADNKTAELAEWDEDLLLQELGELDNFDMTDFGFDMSEIDADDDIDEIIEDTAPEIEEIEPRSKRGDIWKLGNHYLMCGDSTSEADVDQLMNGTVADLVITDPPYNVAVKNSKGMTIENDNLENDEFREFLTNAFYNLEKNLKEGGAFYIWYASKEEINFETALTKANLQVRQQLIWNKNAFILGRSDYHWKHEPCLYGWKDGAAHYFIDDRTQSTVFEDKGIDINKLKKEEMKKLLEELLSDKISTTIINENKPTVNDLHPTMKPLKLIARQMKNSSRKNEVVLDLFGGSGSTLMTAEQLGRKCYTMEYDPVYADAIIQRWENFTGEKAELLNPTPETDA